jgi:hypothetical protein
MSSVTDLPRDLVGVPLDLEQVWQTCWDIVHQLPKPEEIDDPDDLVTFCLWEKDRVLGRAMAVLPVAESTREGGRKLKVASALLKAACAVGDLFEPPTMPPPESLLERADRVRARVKLPEVRDQIAELLRTAHSAELLDTLVAERDAIVAELNRTRPVGTLPEPPHVAALAALTEALNPAAGADIRGVPATPTSDLAASAPEPVRPPTPENCLLPDCTVRWNGTIKLRNQVYRLLEFLLSCQDYPLQPDNVQESIWGHDEVASKTFANIFSELNRYLEQIGFPWTWHVTRSPQFIIRRG